MENELKHSEEFLRKIVGSKTGFSVPNEYLENFETEFELKVSEDSLPSTEGYSLPENYFDSLEDIIIQKTSTQKTKIISLNQQVKKWIPAIAASIALLFALTFIDFSNDELTDEDLISWFENDLSSISTEDLIIAFEDYDLNELDLDSNTITSQSIEEYLTNEDITVLLEDYN